MSRRGWSLAAAVWLVVVITGSGLTWVAINRAGDQVTHSVSGPTTPPGAPDGLRTPSTPSSPSHHPSTGGPAQTSTGRPITSTPPPGSAGLPVPTPSAALSPPVGHTSVRTWTGSAGFVTVSCTDGRVQLRGASPGDGWSYELGDTSGDAVEVTFRTSETEMLVRTTCARGTPDFHVESDRE